MQDISHVVVDKAELPESVHEEADTRTGRPHHFCQSLLTQSGDRHLGHALFAELRHQQKHTYQSFFAGIKKLVDQIILISDVSLQQIFEKYGRQFLFQTQCTHHCLLLDMQKDAVGHRGCRRHAQKLTGKTAFSKEITFAQNAKGCFSPAFRDNAELYFPLLDKKQSVGRIALSEYRVLLLKRRHVPTLPNG